MNAFFFFFFFFFWGGRRKHNKHETQLFLESLSQATDQVLDLIYAISLWGFFFSVFLFSVMVLPVIRLHFALRLADWPRRAVCLTQTAATVMVLLQRELLLLLLLLHSASVLAWLSPRPLSSAYISLSPLLSLSSHLNGGT